MLIFFILYYIVVQYIYTTNIQDLTTYTELNK